MIDSFRDKWENNGVSPVIGVILLVAIVVIVAAVVGILALGFGDGLTDTSTAAVDVKNGEARLIDIGNSDRVLVKESNGNIKENMTKAGDTVSISEGDKIIAVNKGEETLIKKIEGSSSGFTLLEDFEGDSGSDFNQTNLSGSPSYSVVNRKGSDWYKINSTGDNIQANTLFSGSDKVGFRLNFDHNEDSLLVGHGDISSQTEGSLIVQVAANSPSISLGYIDGGSFGVLDSVAPGSGASTMGNASYSVEVTGKENSTVNATVEVNGGNSPGEYSLSGSVNTVDTSNNSIYYTTEANPATAYIDDYSIIE